MTMTLGFTMQHGVSAEPSDEGLLEKQIRLMMAVYANPEGSFVCHVRAGDTFPGKELLADASSPSSKRRFLAFDSIPGSANIKAIGFDGKTLFLEISYVDVPKTLLADEFPKGLRFAKNALWHKSRRLACVSRGEASVGAEYGRRELWMISVDKLPEAELDLTIRAFDAIYRAGTFMSDEEVESGFVTAQVSLTTKVSMRLDQRMDLRMELIQEQVPVLALKLDMSTVGEMQLRQRMDAALSLRMERLLRMSPEEAILQALEKDSSPAGQRRLANFIVFKVARDTRDAAQAAGRELSWQEARQIARRVMYRCSNPP